MGTLLRGSNSAIFIFASLLNRGQLLKERICSSGSQYLPLRVNMFEEGLCNPGKQTGSKNVFSFQILAEKHGGE